MLREFFRRSISIKTGDQTNPLKLLANEQRQVLDAIEKARELDMIGIVEVDGKKYQVGDSGRSGIEIKPL